MPDVKILIADDESRMRKLLKDFLTKEGYEVFEAEDGEQALNVFYLNNDLNLAILDVMMPKVNGYEVLKEIRESSNMPVILLTAKSEESDILAGYDKGADEYICKPFSPKVLVARIQAVLRRTAGEAMEKSLIELGGIVIDQDAHVVTVDGQMIELSVKEFELLLYFVSNAGIALSRDKILNHVWDYDYYGDARTIDTHVKKLRNKLGPKGDYIKTIWGMGYKFEVN